MNSWVLFIIMFANIGAASIWFYVFHLLHKRTKRLEFHEAEIVDHINHLAAKMTALEISSGIRIERIDTALSMH